MFNDHNGLVVTEARVKLVPGAKLKAYVNLTINGALAVTDVRVVEKAGGHLLVAMPNRRKVEGGFRDTTFPCTGEARRWLDAVILAEYDRECRRAVEAELKAAS